MATISRLIPQTVAVVAAVAAMSANSCSSSTSSASPPQTAESAAPADEQGTVDQAAAALERMRTNPEFANMQAYLQRASGVMIFPNLRKGAFIFGGEGGTGVMVARDPAGGWSAPAFCSVGGASVGLQIGYQNASVVLVFMTDRAFHAAVERGLQLGADATVAAGNKSSGASESGAVDTSKDIYQFADAGGVFAGVSLDGLVVASRDSLNQKYYGASATASGIVLQRKIDRPETQVLKQALSRMS
jgi:lipid-binding SYLF domain-containing protein